MIYIHRVDIKKYFPQHVLINFDKTLDQARNKILKIIKYMNVEKQSSQ